MDIQWRYWWDTCQNIGLRCGSVEETLHVAGLLGEKAYGISVKADVRFEKKYLQAAKNIIAAKLQEAP